MAGDNSGKKDDLGNMTELLISVLENYDTDRWILKGSVSCLQLFGEVDCSLADSTVAFHPDHNMVFFFHIWNRKLVSYDMDSKEVTSEYSVHSRWLVASYYPVLSLFCEVIGTCQEGMTLLACGILLEPFEKYPIFQA